MTLEEAKKIPDLHVLIKVGIGKNESIPAYVRRVYEYTAPDGSRRILADVSDSRVKDTVTGERPKVYTSYRILKRDYERLASQNPKVLDIVEA